MFTNLIESSSHTREFRRRGSFFLLTTTTYAVIFVIAGVISIYAYDARLEHQYTQDITMLSPIELEALEPTPAVRNHEPARPNNSRQNYAERATAMSRVNDPRVVPDKPSAVPSKNLPVPERGTYAITGRDFDPGSFGSRVPGAAGQTVVGTRAPVIEIDAPPPLPVEKPKPAIVRKKVINSEALSLPKPPYPPIALSAGVQGMVSVQVLIDENGKVISAKAVSGHPLLIHAAQQAAFGARFSPTVLGDQRVKVSGVITYNFMLQK